jgi:hypothetical protein
VGEFEACNGRQLDGFCDWKRRGVESEDWRVKETLDLDSEGQCVMHQFCRDTNHESDSTQQIDQTELL